MRGMACRITYDPVVLARMTPVFLVLAALAAHAAASLAGRAPAPEREEVLLNRSGHRLAATIHAPAPTATTLPAVVICHGVSARRRHMAPMARAFARAGHLTVSFDYGGHGESEDRPGEERLNVEDVHAAIALAHRQTGAQGGPIALPIALIGHSMGVTSAVQAGIDDPSVATVVAMGQRPFATADRPPRLLAASGAMDAFHPYGSLARAIEASSGGAGVRELYVSGTCEHAGEVYDAAVVGKAMSFIRGEEGGRWAVRVALEASLRFLAAALAAAAVAVGGVRLGRLLPARAVAAILLVVALTPFALGWAAIIGVDAARTWLTPMLLGALIATALLRRTSAPHEALVATIGLAAGWIIGSALTALPAFARDPWLLTGLPLYAWQSIAFRLLYTLESLGARLLQAPLAGEPHGTLVLYAIVAAEVLVPGRALSAAGGVAMRAFRALGGLPRAPAVATAPAARSWRGPGIALAAFVALAVALFVKRSREGLLDDEGALATVALTGLRLIVLPAVGVGVAAILARLLRRS